MAVSAPPASRCCEVSVALVACPVVTVVEPALSTGAFGSFLNCPFISPASLSSSESDITDSAILFGSGRLAII